MISEMSRKISAYFVLNGADESDADVLAYGAECFINLLISDGLLILIGLLTNHVAELLVWSVSFLLMRVNLGGLHAPSHLWCILSGTVVGATSLIISPFWTVHQTAAMICAAGASILAVILAPVRHKNKRHIQKHRRKIKLKVTVTAIAECIAAAVLFYFNFTMTGYIISGLTMATALAAAGAVFNPR